MSQAPAPSAPPSVPANARWRVRLLGSVDAAGDGRTLQRFPSRAVAALLARLAIAPDRAHAREELVELLWPGVDLAVGRNRLRQALSTLKSLLEDGAGAAAAPVLVADRLHVRVVPGALASDVVEFEQLARAGHAAEARALYRGEFMPGFYDEWVDETRQVLAATDDRLTQRLQREAASLASGGGAEARAAPQVPAAPSPVLASARSPAPRVVQHRLPHYVTSLVGAEVALQSLEEQVRAHRLVTVIGPGGCGKTRLAVEVAHRIAASHAPAAGPAHAPFDLVAFAPLAACATRAQMDDALLGALQLAATEADPVDALAEALEGRRALLVLDNLEQLVEVAQEPLARLLAALPGLHVLATSRRALALDGELAHPAESLPVPAAEATLAEAAANPAVALFVQRARAARADFHLGERNAATLAALARALEGLPLAIELAACRVRSIAPAEMLRRLGAGGTPRLALLERGGPRGGTDARHASMQRVIEWSWSQLAPGPARLLAALTVFPGGFTHEAAQAQCAPEPGQGEPGRPQGRPQGRPGPRGPLGPEGSRRPHAGAAEASLLLDELVASSMLVVRTDEDGERMRFAMYETIREYAATQLDEEERRLAAARLRRWALQWALALPATPPLAELAAEMPNLVAALAGALRDDVPHEALELLLALRPALEDVALPAEGLSLACEAVRRATDAVLAARGSTVLGPVLYRSAQPEAALAHAERGLACKALEAAQRARALHALARVRWRTRTDVDTVEPLLDEAEALLDAARSDEPDLRGGVKALRAFVANRLHRRLAEGERLHAEALAAWERGGNQHAVNSGRYNLAVAAEIAGRRQEALDRLAPVIDSARALGNWRLLSQALNVRANAYCGLRRWADAADDYRECIRVAWQSMSSYELAYGLWNLPRALMHLRRPQQGAALAAYSEATWRAHYGTLNRDDEREVERARRLAARLLDTRQVEAAWRQGAALTTAQAVALALDP